MVTATEYDLAADATRHAMRLERERLGRLPTDVETIVHTLAEAYRVLRIAKPIKSFTSNPSFESSLGGRFVELGCRVDGNAGGEQESITLDDVSRAQAVISIFDQLGVLPVGLKFKMINPEKDKAVLDAAAEQFSRGGIVNERAIGRAIGLSHTQVGVRLRARSERIMGRLRSKFPSSFRLHPPRRPKGYTYADALPAVHECGRHVEGHRPQP